MSVVGLDLNATRARAVYGAGQGAPVGLNLEDDRRELPLAISLADRSPVVGAAGAMLRRKAPHLACIDFLSVLGQKRQWAVGRHRLDAAGAVRLVFERLYQTFGRAEGVVLTLPTYLTDDQEIQALQLAGKARWPLLGAAPAPTAAAIAAYERLPWAGLALVADVDGHALTWSAVSVEAEHVQLIQTHVCPHLGLGAWLNRLLNGAAGRCVRLSRRDPRGSADSEQSLYDQLARLLASGGPTGGTVQLNVQSPQWYQNLMLSPEELADFCAPLVRQSLAEMQSFASSLAAQGTTAALIATAAAGALPGLTAALEDHLQRPAIVRAPLANDGGDFGANLPLDDDMTATRVHLLDADAVARGAHDLAGRVLRGELARGRIDAAPLPSAADEGGPARLQFRGCEHPVTKAVFVLGRDPMCDMVFESELYPSVSARHCEIALDRGAYLLRDRSRHGTLLNDHQVNQQAPLHSGDWVRLGPGGPVLRFLGRPAEQRRLMTTA
jgi:FHA domain